MASDNNPNIRQRQSIRPANRQSGFKPNDSIPEQSPTFSNNPTAHAGSTNIVPTASSGSALNTSRNNAMPVIKRSDKANEAEKLLESNSSLLKLQNNLNMLDVFINNRHMEMLSPASGLNVSYINDVKGIDPSLKDMSGISIYCIEKIMLNPDESTYEKLVSLYSALGGIGGVLAYILQSDGSRTRLYLCCHVNGREWANNAGEMISSNFNGQFPGSSLYKISDNEKQKLLRSFGAEKKNNDTVVKALSMIPGRRQVEIQGGDKISAQGFEKFIDTMQNYEYTLIILNQKISNSAMDQCKSGYEMMYTMLSSFSKENVSYSETDSISQSLSVSDTFSETINDSISNSFGTSRTDSTSSGSNRGKSYQSTGWFGFEYTNTNGTNNSTSMSDSTNEGTQKGRSTGTSKGTTSSEQNGTSTGSNRTITIARDNKGVIDMMELLDEHIKRIDQNHVFGMWNSCCYVVADAKVSTMAVSTLSSILAGDDTVVPHAYYNSWDVCNVAERNKVLDHLQYLSHPQIELNINQGDMVQLVTPAMMVSGKEMPILCNLPSKSVSGVVVTSMADFGRNVSDEWKRKIVRPIDAGKVYHMGHTEKTVVDFDLNAFSSHCFVCGASGSGKSNTTYNLIKRFIENKIPFLVIEPVKGEYKKAFSKLGKINIFTADESAYRRLQINPFEFNQSIHIREHLDRLTEVIGACWPLYGAMPGILKQAFERVYTAHGWDLNYSERVIEIGSKFPTFKDLEKCVEEVIDESTYTADTKGDYKGALLNRIRSLNVGFEKDIFGSSIGIPSRVLFDTNTIIDLSSIGSDETRSLIMGVLIIQLREFRKVTVKTSNNPTRHVTVLEEAHNILKRCSKEASSDAGNVVGKSVSMLCDCIAEMRSLGEGFMIVDQSPSAVDDTAIKNTAIKIVMRLPFKDDFDIMGDALALTESQRLELSKLDTGVAAVFHSGWGDTMLVKMGEKWDDTKYGSETEVALDKNYLIKVKGAIVQYLYKKINEKDLRLIKDEVSDMLEVIDKGGLLDCKVQELLFQVECFIDDNKELISTGKYSKLMDKYNEFVVSFLKLWGIFNMIPMSVSGSKDIGSTKPRSKSDLKMDKITKSLDEKMGDVNSNKVKKYHEWEESFRNVVKKYLCMPLICDGDVLKWPYNSSDSEYFEEIYIGLLRYMANRYSSENSDNPNHNKYKDAVSYLFKKSKK